MDENTSNSAKRAWRLYPDDADVARAAGALRERRPEFVGIELSQEASRYVKRWPVGCAYMALEEAFECAAYAGRGVVLAIDVPFVSTAA